MVNVQGGQRSYEHACDNRCSSIPKVCHVRTVWFEGEILGNTIELMRGVCSRVMGPYVSRQRGAPNREWKERWLYRLVRMLDEVTYPKEQP